MTKKLYTLLVIAALALMLSACSGLDPHRNWPASKNPVSDTYSSLICKLPENDFPQCK